MISKLRCIFSLVLAFSGSVAYAQAPVISYNTPQTFTTGSAITPLTPMNTGGAVPASVYGQVSTIAGTVGVNGKANGIGTNASFFYPDAVGVNSAGNLFIADDFNALIRMITPAGVVTTYAGSGQFGGQDGPASLASFDNDIALVIDANNNVYLAESGNNVIRKITPGGVVSTLAGQLNTYGFANGQGTAAIFGQPTSMTIDKTGNLYVTDLSNSVIRKITPGGFVSTFAGQQGVSGSANGYRTKATFNQPYACAADAQGNIYVGEYGSRLIRKIAADGTVTTFAGSGNNASVDGLGKSASFNQPNYLAADPGGNIYVSDLGVIRKIAPTGMVTTLAGDTSFIGSVDGVGKAARFYGPEGLASDAMGDIYVTDAGNQTIRKIVTTGYAIDKPLPSGLSFDATTGIISGTPVAFSAPTQYTITAYNVYGMNSTTITVAVTGTLNFPPIAPVLYGSVDLNPATSTAGAITYTTSNTAVGTIVAGKIHILNTGTATITASNGSTTIQQILTVNPAPLTVIADNKSKVLGAVNPPLTITYSGFVNATDITRVAPSITTTATTSSPPGDYPIVVSGGGYGNYTYNYVDGDLTILGGQTTLAAPIISYPTSKNYTAGNTISPLAPANSGGHIPANVYSQVTTLAGTVGVSGSNNGPGSQASFNQPKTSVIDASGNAYVADQLNNLIRKITPDGIVSTFAGSGAAGSLNGLGTSASFNYPGGLAIDAVGNLYVADGGNYSIRKITPQGMVSTFAAGQNMLGPNSIAIDKNGYLYITDQCMVYKITPAGVAIPFAGREFVQGSQDGQGTAATFRQPSGITIDALGNIYVADIYTIRKITPGGLVSTFVGNGKFGSFDGTGTAAGFGFCAGIVCDQAGNLYVTDQNNIRKITPESVVTTFAGYVHTPSYSNDEGNGYIDAIGTNARFGADYGLGLDNSGNLFVSESGNELIRKVSTTGYSIDKTLPSGLTFDPTTGIISGTPIGASPATAYTITGNNVSGGSTAIVTISVAPSQNAGLSSLTLSAGSIAPAFSTAHTAYTASVPYINATIMLTPTTVSPNAKITINGTAVASGTASTPIALAVGPNTINTIVTAEDGIATKTYTVTVTRMQSTDATLSQFKISRGTLTPVFAPGTTSYTANVANGVTSFTITPTTNDANATVKVNGTVVAQGTASAAIPLSVGTHNIVTKVTAADGVTSLTYTLSITRAPSSNANLSLIKLSRGALSPVFTAATTSYTATVANGVTSLTVTPTTVNTAATITVNGSAVTSGTASGAITLASGVNTITVQVTAQDGTTQNTYTIAVTRSGPINIPDESLSVDQPAVSPSMDDDVIIVHQGISPNGDGINDFLVIDGILAYPDNKLSVMNRNGALVFEAKGYDNASKVFDGHSNKNGQMQLPGTYFYQLAYTVNGITKHKTGYLVLKY